MVISKMGSIAYLFAFIVAAMEIVLFSNCSSPKSVASPPSSASESAWNAETALQSPGPSTAFGNWGKAITTDGAGYVDVVWLQGGTTVNDGSIVYVGTGSIVFAQSADHGVAWTKSALTAISPNTSLPKITSVGSEIYVVWSALDAATSTLKIFVRHGSRMGNQVQWSTAKIISSNPAGANATFPVVAAYGNDVHVAWSDARNSGASEVYYTRSIDKGGTWSTPLVISPVDGFNSWTPSLAVYEGYVYLAWTDARFGPTDCATNTGDCHEVLYIRRSIDSGQTWGSETELTCNFNIYTYAPSLFVENDMLHIAYFQGSPTAPGRMDLYYLRAPNNGANLTACSGTQGTQPKISVQYPTGDNVLSAWRPNISVHNGIVHLVWWGELTNSYNGGQAKVYYTNSSDGVNWANASSLTPQGSGSTYRSFAPDISLSEDGSMAYTIWLDHRNDTNAMDPNYQIFFRSKSL